LEAPLQKPTALALATFDSVFPEADPRAVRKNMFGMPAGFVNGNMFMGVWADGVVLRLDDATLAKLQSLPGVGSFEPMEGRPWKDYVLVDAGQWGEARELPEWIAKSLDHTAKMPPKASKKAKAAPTKPAAAKKARKG
jgi:TfoX/Sxy family transcriptional regulator of competence genes